MTAKRYTYKDNVIYRNGVQYSTLNPSDICDLLDRLEEARIKMDEQIRELKIENISRFNKEDFEDSLYEAYRLYAINMNLTYSERLLVADFSDNIIQNDVFSPSKKEIKK